MMKFITNNTKGRKLVIYENNNTEPVISQDLFIDGDIDLKVSSKYEALWKAGSNSLMNLVSSSFSFGGKALPSGQFPMQGIQTWDSTDPLSFDLTANLYMNTSGRDDVLKPALTLMNYTLPTKDKGLFSDTKVGNYSIKIETLIPPGPNIQAIIEASGGKVNNKTDSKEMGSLTSVVSKGVFKIKIADYLIIDKVIIKSVNTKFSHILDEEGFPTSAQLNFEFMTMEVATTDMMAQIATSSSAGGLLS